MQEGREEIKEKSNEEKEEKLRSSGEKKNTILPAILLNPRDFPFQNLNKENNETE